MSCFWTFGVDVTYQILNVKFIAILISFKIFTFISDFIFPIILLKEYFIQKKRKKKILDAIQD